MLARAKVNKKPKCTIANQNIFACFITKLGLELEFFCPAKPASEAWASAVSDCRFLSIKEQLRKNFLPKRYTAAKKIGHNGPWV